jgi:hypothetical protein
MAENALRAALTHIGFNVQAARQITDTQDLNTLKEVKLLKDDEITNLCKVLRCPGGLIQDPNPIDPANVGMINNPGVIVPMQAQTNCNLPVSTCATRTASRAQQQLLR